MTTPAPFIGIVTELAIADILSQPELIQITSFAVSDVLSDLDPSRTTTNTTWFQSVFSSPGEVNDDKILIQVSVPPSTPTLPLTDGSLISEIYLFAKTDGGPEYLFAIVHPPNDTPITYSALVKYDINMQIQFSAGNTTGIFEFIYNANEVSTHDVDPYAHQQRWVLKSGDTMTGALHGPSTTILTSSAGVLTLNETSNSFLVNGTEAITSIIGWTKGTATIRWNTVRTITYNASSLITINRTNRTTQVGDVGIYEFSTSGVREISYAPVNDYARANGNSSNVFNVADGVSGNNAINYGQLSGSINTLNTNLLYNIQHTSNYFLPYSINSGNTDVYGYGDIINKVSDTSVSFKVGGAYANMGITFPNGNYYVISSIATLSGLSLTNGTYIFTIEESSLVSLGGGLYSAVVLPVTNVVTEQYTTPAGIDGDYNLLINQRPLLPQKKISGAWATTQFMKIGECTKTSSLMSTPITYSFNGRFTKVVSVPNVSTNTNYIHAIGTQSIVINPYLINIVTEHGYTPGMKAEFMVQSSSASMKGFNPKDRISVDYISGNGNAWVQSYSILYAAAITRSNWNMEINIQRGF